MGLFLTVICFVALIFFMILVTALALNYGNPIDKPNNTKVNISITNKNKDR
jgi:hypothetical protein